ncbi:MAG TPA: SDR family oxidoreductase [Anaerolineales bacterium]|nr:SDR family oxidoreductase [Anaerolineales bacterium]
MSSLRILITGINGLIGSILREALSASHAIYGLDREGPFSERVAPVDVAGYQQVAQAVQRFSPLDRIIHLAGDPRVKASWEEVLGANIMGTRNVFEAAREFNISRVIFASSNHVTGAYLGFDPNEYLRTQPEPRIISTTNPIRPDSEYGVSKAFGEAIARFYYDRWGVEAICLRIGAVIKDDSPVREPINRRIWLSHRDLVQLVEKILTANIPFGI